MSIDRSDALRLVEALLFASATPVDEAGIAARLPDGTDIPQLLADLASDYESRGVQPVKVAGGWTFRTAPDLGPRLRLEMTVTRKLSRAAVETLAIIAYHQPVSRAEIEEIRGVQISKGTIDTLLEIGWIMPKGRRETVGRPITWGTSDEFLHHFGLAGITDLPGMDELKAAGLIGRGSVITLAESALPENLPDDSLDETGEEAPELEPLIDSEGADDGED